MGRGHFYLECETKIVWRFCCPNVDGPFNLGHTNKAKQKHLQGLKVTLVAKENDKLNTWSMDFFKEKMLYGGGSFFFIYFLVCSMERITDIQAYE